jgi:hypothetical protein
MIADTGDPDGVIAVYRDALRLAREVQRPDDEAIALRSLGEITLSEGNVEDGAARPREALEIFRRLGTPAAYQVTARLAEIGIPLPGLRGRYSPRSTWPARSRAAR